MQKLISMTDFVLKQKEKWTLLSEGCYPTVSKYKNVVILSDNYANFLKQNLTLGMFVPCDLDENILQEASGADFLSNHDMDKFLEYEEAKERILFKGWYIEEKCVDSIVIGNKDVPASIEFSENGIWFFDEHKGVNIEHFSFYSEKEKIKIVLTESAKKQIFGS